MKKSMRQFEAQFSMIEDLIRCSVGEPRYVVDSSILKAIKESLDQLVHNYPPVREDEELLNRLASKHQIDSSQIVITHGASEAMSAFLVHY